MEYIDDVQSDQLDQYLLGEMSPAERSDFEGLLAENPALQAALSERRDLVRGIRDAAWGDLRLAMDEELDALEQEERLRRWKKRGLWAVAGVLLLAGLWLGWLWFLEEKKVEPEMPEIAVTNPLDSFSVSGEFEAYTFAAIDTDRLTIKVRPRPMWNFDVVPRNDTSWVQTKQENHSNPNEPTPSTDRFYVATGARASLADLTDLSARRVLASAGQKNGEEPLPAMPFKVYTDTAMQCVFLGSELRLFVPPDFAEGQRVEIVQLRGAGAADGYYLKVGPQIYPMKNDRGHPFRLEPADDAAVLRLLLE